MKRFFKNTWLNLFAIFIVLLVLGIHLTDYASTKAQTPAPYVPCDEVRDDEFHSLRPYQASPCNVPIKNNEQAIICGNDLIVNDKIYLPQDEHRMHQCRSNCCGCNTECYFEAFRDFKIYFNAYESELPIAGQTELVPAGDPPNIGPEIQWREEATGAINDQGFIDHPPPDPNDFSNYQDYYRAYKEWRGSRCLEVTIPIIGRKIFFCFDDPTRPNFWSKFYPNIPYTSTEDRVGKADVSDMIWDPDKSSVDRIVPNPPITEWDPKQTTPVNQNTADNESALSFPHMEENVEATSLLQSTFLPPEILDDAQETYQPIEAPNEECRLVDVRKNPGDQLFGEHNGPLGIPSADVIYRAWFWCDVHFTPEEQGCEPEYSCEENSWFHSDVTIYTPMIDELYARTVEGSASVVRKIFPKVGAGGPITEIKDIPASTDVQHMALPVPRRSHPELISTNAEFYIPHFGSIYDYFLQNIQTLLRPQDFPAEPANLTSNSAISEEDRVNEYLSWYLNGTIYRAENDPLNPKEESDIYKVVNLSGPLNKLLSQQSQWRNFFNFQSISYPGLTELPSGKVDTANEAAEGEIRHNQISGCVIGFTIPIPIINNPVIGFPAACNLAFMNNLPGSGPGTGGPTPTPSSGTCPQVPDTEISQTYIAMKDNFIRIANTYGVECNLAEECYNYVVKTSAQAGVNPALSLALWAHESAASNYCRYPGVEDFGVHYIPGQDLVNQLNTWIAIARGQGSEQCYQENPGWRERLHAFMSQYRLGSGICDPTNEEGNRFYQEMIQMFQNVSDPVAACVEPGYTGFLIDSPTDQSCP